MLLVPLAVYGVPTAAACLNTAGLPVDGGRWKHRVTAEPPPPGVFSEKEYQSLAQTSLNHSSMKVEISNVNIFRGFKSTASDEDLGHLDIGAALVKALTVAVPLHNQDHDASPVSLAGHLKQGNLHHMMVTSQCFMLATYVVSHKEPPLEKEKLIRVDKLGKYELGAACTVVVTGGYCDGSHDGDGVRVVRIVPGEIIRHMEFIFDTSTRIE